MRGAEFWSFALATCLASCHANPDDASSHVDERHPGDEAGQEDANCGDRGKPLSGVVLTPEDDSIDARLALISATPSEPIVGNNSWLFELTVDGEPASGLAAAVSVTPFMPDHGHGTPTIVRTEEVETGRYKFEPVHTRMAGYWEVTVLVDAPVGQLSFVVKVCVD
jgi:YtkA-like